jgi:ADP-heptose:LPS heptosyltransferase
MVLIVIVASCLLVNAHNRARQDLIETLTMERQIREQHQKLASDMAGITRSRLLALKAKERLGLTKPKDEEVLVLK